MTDKAQAKIELKIGNMSFSGEGDQVWLDKQVTKLLEAAATGPIGNMSAAGGTDASAQAQEVAPGGSLASYLKAKGGDNKQVQRFLATAAWIFKRGQKDLSTSIISKTLTEHHQKKLANPADCLNKNVSKGYCEKIKDGFFITPEGWAALGEQQ